jgi:hypothetical protein
LNGSYVDNDAVFSAHGVIELVDESVHRVFHLPAVIVPHGYCNGILGIKFPLRRAAPEKQYGEHQMQDYCQCNFSTQGFTSIRFIKITP